MPKKINEIIINKITSFMKNIGFMNENFNLLNQE